MDLFGVYSDGEVSSQEDDDVYCDNDYSDYGESWDNVSVSSMASAQSWRSTSTSASCSGDYSQKQSYRNVLLDSESSNAPEASLQQKKRPRKEGRRPSKAEIERLSKVADHAFKDDVRGKSKEFEIGLCLCCPDESSPLMLDTKKYFQELNNKRMGSLGTSLTQIYQKTTTMYPIFHSSGFKVENVFTWTFRKKRLGPPATLGSSDTHLLPLAVIVYPPTHFVAKLSDSVGSAMRHMQALHDGITQQLWEYSRFKSAPTTNFCESFPAGIAKGMSEAAVAPPRIVFIIVNIDRHLNEHNNSKNNKNNKLTQDQVDEATARLLLMHNIEILLISNEIELLTMIYLYSGVVAEEVYKPQSPFRLWANNLSGDSGIIDTDYCRNSRAKVPPSIKDAASVEIFKRRDTWANIVSLIPMLSKEKALNFTKDNEQRFSCPQKLLAYFEAMPVEDAIKSIQGCFRSGSLKSKEIKLSRLLYDMMTTEDPTCAICFGE